MKAWNLEPFLLRVCGVKETNYNILRMVQMHYHSYHEITSLDVSSMEKLGVMKILVLCKI